MPTKPMSLLIGCLVSVYGCQSEQHHCYFDQTTLGLTAIESANAGCVVTNDDNQLLSIRSPLGGLSIPGGTANHESAACTAIRETKEETNLDVTPTQLLTVWPNGFYIFKCNINHDSAQAAINQPDEVFAIQWVKAENMEKFTWRFPKQKDWLKTYINSQPSLLEKSIDKKSEN